MRKTFWVIGGLVAAALAAGFFPFPSHPGDAIQAVSITLPDLDADKVPEKLQVTTSGQDTLAVTLVASAGKFTHPVMNFTASWPLTVTGALPRWRLTDATGHEVFEARVVTEAGRKVPDLAMVSATDGKRYRWVDRGFLKLDARTFIPGFSVGLAMLGDTPVVLGQLGDKATAQGLWRPLAPTGVQLELTAGPDGRLAAATCASPTLVGLNGVTVGASEGELAKRFPGKRVGDRWIAPTYGVVAQLDAGGHAREIQVGRPWTEKNKVAAKPAQ